VEEGEATDDGEAIACAGPEAETEAEPEEEDEDVPMAQPTETTAEDDPPQSSTPEMKRSAVRSLIQRYFHQLQSGCGNAHCSNANCASSGKVAPMTPNEVAARALQLFSQDAQLCEPSTSAASRWESFTHKWVVPSRNQPVVLVR